MPWFELMDELSELICDATWGAAKDVSFLQEALYDQIGAKVLDDLALDQEPASETPVQKKRRETPTADSRDGLK